jgi:glycosyltransferase involved in cell wall biosynthesis
VLLLTSSYAPVLGGLQTVTRQLAQGLAQRGHAVQVAANRYPRHLAAQEVLDGISVSRLLMLAPDVRAQALHRPDLLLGSLYCYPLGLRLLARLFQTFQPEVVNVHFPDAQNAFVLWLRRHFDFRLVVSLHGNDIERWTPGGPPFPARALTPLARARLAGVLQAADSVTACSAALLRTAVRFDASVERKGRVIYNGIDLARFATSDSYSHPRPYLLAVGRLTAVKGVDLLLEAFAEAAAKHSGVDLLIAGEGEAAAQLVRLTERLGLHERVVWLGRVGPEEIVRLLNGCLFFVMPSRHETFGISALEALAAGRPIIATAVGGLPEVLRGSASQCVPPDSTSLARALEDWLASPPVEEDARRVNRACAGHFAWASTLESYEAVLRG